MKKTFVAVACLCAAAGSAWADTGVGLKVSTLGLGLDVARPLTETVNLRGTVNFLNWSRTFEESDVDYDAKVKLQTVGALADWHPWGSGFRVSVGAYYNKNRLTLHARPTAGSTINLGGESFALGSELQSADARVRFRKTAPYVGIGWGNASSKTNTWSVVADLGVLYQQTPRSTLTATCAPTADAAVCDRIQSRAAIEQAELRDGLADFRWYPVVSIGLAYRF